MAFLVQTALIRVRMSFFQAQLGSPDPSQNNCSLSLADNVVFLAPVGSATPLRASYAVSATHLRYAATGHPALVWYRAPPALYRPR
eukprot:3072260-Rhodomonas_salina.1